MFYIPMHIKLSPDAPELMYGVLYIDALDWELKKEAGAVIQENSEGEKKQAKDGTYEVACFGQNRLDVLANLEKIQKVLGQFSCTVVRVEEMRNR